MFDFDQYLGFLAFLTILTIGFWLMFFADLCSALLVVRQSHGIL